MTLRTLSRDQSNRCPSALFSQFQVQSISYHFARFQKRVPFQNGIPLVQGSTQLCRPQKSIQS